MPDGMRWNFHSSSPRTIVWPALLPPWKRTTASPRSASRSVILPLPSSPHWAPTTTIPGIAAQCMSRSGSDRGHADVGAEVLTVIGTEQGKRITAHLDEARHGAGPDLLGEVL